MTSRKFTIVDYIARRDHAGSKALYFNKLSQYIVLKNLKRIDMRNLSIKKLCVGATVVASFAFLAVGHAQNLAGTTVTSTKTPPRGYMVVTYDIKDQAAFQQYMDAAGSLAGKYHGKVTVFNMQTKAVEGKSRSVIGIAEFPSLADAERFYYSPEYTAARKFRAAATQGTSTMILTEGLGTD